VPYEVEVPQHVIESVDIRQFITKSIAAGDLSDELVASLRTIRAACRKFMERVGARERVDDSICRESAPGRIRTCDPLLRRQPLYPLSYRRVPPVYLRQKPCP